MGTVTSIEYKYQLATLGCQMDISFQKRAEDALKQSEERSRTLIDSITDACYEVDLAGNLPRFNEPYLKLYGYRQEEMMGINYKRFVDKKNADIVTASLGIAMYPDHGDDVDTLNQPPRSKLRRINARPAAAGLKMRTKPCRRRKIWDGTVTAFTKIILEKNLLNRHGDIQYDDTYRLP